MPHTKNETVHRLRAVLDASYNGIIEIDRYGRINNLNQAMERILGKTGDELIGLPLQEVVPNAGLPEVIETGQPQIGQQITLGERVYISNRTPILQNDSVIGAVAVLQDVTELQNITKELETTRNLKELLETVLHTAYDRIVVVDAEARIMMITQAYCDFLGVQQTEVLGKPVTEVIENTRMHIVLQTGQTEIEQVQRIKGYDMICSRIPLKREGKVWAAVGKVMFRDVSDLHVLMKKADTLQSELEYYKDELRRHQGIQYCIDNITGESERIRLLKDLVRKVARNTTTVLIRGESGTGKELFAHALHYASPRSHRPFVKVNCAAVPENLLESELFGYQEGAFTGARKGGKIGKFELANGGTIFLDEIGDMPINMQVKLLRVLQEKEIERLGDNKQIKIDVRVIAATNRNLEELIGQRQFRKDLFYRLNVVVLDVPPLRERLEDIPALSATLMDKLSKRLGVPKKALASSALEALQNYTWPGNIRELENALERALNIVEDDIISVNHLPLHIRGEQDAAEQGLRPMKEAVENLERALMMRALKESGGDCLTAARLLHVSKSVFYERMIRYGIRSCVKR